MDAKRLRKITKVITYATLVVPWVYYSYDGGYAVIFSVFSTNSFRNITDIYSYTFRYTQGTFYSGFLFWHVSLLLVFSSVVSVIRDRGRLGGILMVFGAVSVFRFGLAFAENVSYVIPIGSVWMLLTAALLRYTYE